MPSRFEKKQPDLSKLKSTLLTSGLQQKDNPLYQVINHLIDFVERTFGLINTSVAKLESSAVTAAANDKYDIGNFILQNGEFRVHANQLRLTGFNRLTLGGDSRIVLIG